MPTTINQNILTQFKNFSYNEAIRNYADMQNMLRIAIRESYDNAYSGAEFNKHRHVYEQVLHAINVFEPKENGEPVAFPTEAELKKLDKDFVATVLAAKTTTENFMKVLKDKYFVKNRDEFADKYGKDIRIDREADIKSEMNRLYQKTYKQGTYTLAVRSARDSLGKVNNIGTIKR